MTVEQDRSGGREHRPRPTRAQRIVAAGFLSAFGLTMLTVLLTGLWVRAPRPRAGVEAAPPAPATELSESGEAAAPPTADPNEPRASESENKENRSTDESREPAKASELVPVEER
jgi:hypothetical protein